MSIDLDRVGVDGEIDIPSQEKAERVKVLLDSLHYLYRDIRGRRENLSPLFIIGGRYQRKNPFFENSTTENKDQNTDQSSDESSDQSSTDDAE